MCRRKSYPKSCLWLAAGIFVLFLSPAFAQEDFYKNFNPTGTDFPSVVKAFEEISKAPDNRTFDVHAIQLPEPIPFEKLTSDQASKGLHWYGPGKYSVMVSQKSREHFRDVVVPALHRFFSKIATEVKEVRYESTTGMGWGSVGEIDYRGIYKSYVKGASQLLVCKEPDLGPFLHSNRDTEGRVKNVPCSLEFTIYAIPDAYGNNLPDYLTEKPASKVLYSYLTSEEGVYLFEIPVVSTGRRNACRHCGHGNYNYAVFADWPLNITGEDFRCETTATTEPFCVPEEVAKRAKKVVYMVERPKTLTVPDQVESLELACRIIDDGGVITLKPGTYTVDETLHLFRNFTIQGATGKPNDVVIQSSKGPVLKLTIYSNRRDDYFVSGSVTLKDLTIKTTAGKEWPFHQKMRELGQKMSKLFNKKGSERAYESAQKEYEEYCDNNSSDLNSERREMKNLCTVLFEEGDQQLVNCRIESDSGFGVYVSGGTAPTLNGCEIANCYGYGVYCSSSKKFTMSDCAIRQITGTGIFIDYKQNPDISGVVIENVDTGILAGKYSEGSVQGCTFRNVLRNGIRIRQDSSTKLEKNTFKEIQGFEIYDDNNPPKPKEVVAKENTSTYSALTSSGGNSESNVDDSSSIFKSSQPKKLQKAKKNSETKKKTDVETSKKKPKKSAFSRVFKMFLFILIAGGGWFAFVQYKKKKMENSSAL